MPLSRRSAVGLMVMNAVSAAAPASAQFQTTQPSPSSPGRQIPDITGNREGEDATTTAMKERMRVSAEKAANDDRRKRMLADTDKLLTLSTELKADIEKSSKDELSMAVIRKAAEIEKLAHDVQQRMKN